VSAADALTLVPSAIAIIVAVTVPWFTFRLALKQDRLRRLHDQRSQLYVDLLTEAHAAAGQAEAGLDVLAEALALVDHTGERYWEAEIYRLKGDLLLQQAVPDMSQAEACFQQALTVARRQQAKSLELRTAMSLARLWQQRGKRAEARQLLAEVYGWFTEGFDTPDLQEAKVLLDELA